MKYGNRKTEVDGIVFDSRKEASWYLDLKFIEQTGLIQNLRRQVKFELIPAQKGEIRNERPVYYIADFVYEENGKTIVEDVKSEITRKNKEYIIKRKLMKYIHGIEVREV
jgi:hypothetical protein